MKKEIYDLLQKLYKAYIDKDCKKLKSFLSELKEYEEKEPLVKGYVLKYEKLYNSICNKTGISAVDAEKLLLKIRGKTVKCVKCGAPLVLDDYNKKVLEDYKKGNINQLKFRCNFCRTEFVWDTISISPMFLRDIGIGKEVVFDFWEYNNKFRVAGVVRYKGEWKEGRYKGTLYYNEYFLYNTRGERVYLAEVVYSDLGEREREIEVSYKVNNINVIKFDEKNIYFSDNTVKPIKEINIVKVDKIYGEVGKSYRIGELVYLYEFEYGGEDYVLEIEGTDINKEINIYRKILVRKNRNLSFSKVSKIERAISGFDLSEHVGTIGIIIILFWMLPFLLDAMVNGLLFIVMFLLFIFGIIALSNDFYGSKRVYYFVLIYMFLILVLAGYKFTGFYLDKTKQKILDISNISDGRYNVSFSSSIIFDDFVKSYSQGGKEYKIKYYKGFDFKIEKKEDITILKQLLENESLKQDIKQRIFSYLKYENKKAKLKDYKDFLKGGLILYKYKF